MRAILVALTLVLAVLLVIFGVENNQLVNVRFLGFNSGYTSLSLVVMVSAVVGAALLGLLGTWDAIRRGFSSRRDVQERARLERENGELRSRIGELERVQGQAALASVAEQPLSERAVGTAQGDLRL